MFEGWDDDASITSGDGCFEIFESILVEEGVIAFIPELFTFDKIGEFSTEYSVFHVSVRLYYNWQDH